MSLQPHLVFVVGPTACGKSEFAVEAAEGLTSVGSNEPPFEIINADSVQFFAGLEIGAARPSAEQVARVSHHLYGHQPLGAAYTAADFRRETLALLKRRQCESGVWRFFLVGGSGFYFQALEKGMYQMPPAPEPVRQKLQDDLSKCGLSVLYEELNERDAEAAARISPQDRYRILRALEYLRSDPNRQKLSALRRQFEEARKSPPFKVTKIGLICDRKILRHRVEARTSKMLKRGFIEEVIRLLDGGYADWPPLRSVGYREVREMLQGRIAPDELEGAIVTSTMQLAKRQMTWFKRDLTIKWFDCQEGWDQPLEHLRKVFGS